MKLLTVVVVLSVSPVCKANPVVERLQNKVDFEKRSGNQKIIQIFQVRVIVVNIVKIQREIYTRIFQFKMMVGS